MIKINYPHNKTDLSKITTKFWDLFKNEESDYNNLVAALTDAKLKFFFSKISYKKIILEDIEYLSKVFDDFEKLPDHMKNHINMTFKDIFSYNQPLISHFFENIDPTLNLKACYYCNLDSISIFSTLHGYKDDWDFLRFASKAEITDIKRIGSKTAEKIIQLANRENYSPFATHPEYVKRLLKALKRNRGKSRNHFTLDHYIPQNRCCLFARSLYNFVPSCYVCNSKLKKTQLFSDNIKDLYKYSPTYHKYEQTGEVKFSLIQKNIVQIFDYDKFGNSDFWNNFNIDIKPVDPNNRIIPILHLRQRYHIHKETAVRFAYLKEKYSDTAITEIVKILSSSGSNISISQIKKDLFNPPKHDNESLSKLCKDILKQFNIQY